ncbi:putative ABC transporter permease [Clostridioides difficile]
MEFIYNFFIYGFIGWVIENLFSYYINKRFQEDSFLRGPFKPMYAIAMAWIIELNKAFPNIIFLVFISMLIPTTVEYITGLLMRKVFNKDYWDYCNEKFNYKGIICLRFSIAWVALSIIDVKIIHPYFIHKIYSLISVIWPSIAISLIILLIIDEVITLRSFINKGQIN